MVYRADIALRAADGRPLAAVEIKNREELTPTWAALYRRNLIAHGLLPELKYFLILSEDRGYLWTAVSTAELSTAPTARFPMSEVVSRYLPTRDPSQRLKGVQLELLVLHWLTELSAGAREPSEEPESLLAPTGFLDDVVGASILVESPL